MTPEEVSDLIKKSSLPEKGEVQAQIDKLNNLMGAVVIILIVMVATLLITVSGIVIDAYNYKASSYQSLETKINDIETTISLTK